MKFRRILAFISVSRNCYFLIKNRHSVGHLIKPITLSWSVGRTCDKWKDKYVSGKWGERVSV
jgi:hypothetical protein